MRKPVAAAFVCFFTGNAFAATIHIQNKSWWEIREVYFAPSSQAQWGKDRLGERILGTGDILSITGVIDGKWDVRMVDENAGECLIKNQQIKSSETFVIKDEDLLGCEARQTNKTLVELIGWHFNVSRRWSRLFPL